MNNPKEVIDENTAPENDQNNLEGEKVVVSVTDPTTPLEQYTFKQLCELAQKEGVPDPITFKTKKQLIWVINTNRQKGQSAPAVAPVNDNVREDLKHYRSKAERQKYLYEHEPLVQVMIPLEGQEKPGRYIHKLVDGREVTEQEGAFAYFCENGYRTWVPKGVSVKVPERIAKLLGQSQAETLEAGKDFLIDRLANQDNSPVRTVREALE
jgi:hypothetical protein